MAGSKIRLDPISGAFDLRVYAVPGDPAVPLAAEMRQYHTVGRVMIAGDLAVVSGVHGTLRDSATWVDFDTALQQRGVREVRWERHKHGGILIKRRRIKA